jgi:hypothetical protein
MRTLAAAHQQQHFKSLSQGLAAAAVGGSSSSRLLFCMARPRLLIAGPPGSGQQQLAAAVLAAVEGLPVHAVGLPQLLANAASRSALIVQLQLTCKQRSRMLWWLPCYAVVSQMS